METKITNPVGMLFYQNSLWVADGESGKIIQQDPHSRAVQQIYTSEPYSTQSNRIAGMACDGQSIWICGQKSGKIYRHAVVDLKKISL